MKTEITTKKDEAADRYDAAVKKEGIEVVHTKIASGIVADATKTVKSTEDLVKRTLEAHEALKLLMESFMPDWFKMMEANDTRLHELRTSRMAMESEVKHMLTQLKDVRQFFLDRDYEQERDRLKEFVHLCERLKALKESGFLDTVADTMLALAPKQLFRDPMQETEINALKKELAMRGAVLDELGRSHQAEIEKLQKQVAEKTQEASKAIRVVEELRAAFNTRAKNL